eukprot:TRINITY_DN12432_c0_g3_i1.p2 TRINITY_DN12432_c0_g3~~TRINITY_DN12432_c0_g3_i1.p2  ORF type:complete len:472 (+),score=91.80 TRINITY_DN12432_c0_g3_i1:83-1498(+)
MNFALNFEKHLLSDRRLHLEVKADLCLLSKGTFEDFRGGSAILVHFKSHIEYLRQLYPSFRLSFGDLERVARGHWDREAHRRFYLEEVARRLVPPVRVQGDWRGLKEAEIRRHHGTALFARYPTNWAFIASCFGELPWQNFEGYSTSWGQEEHRRYVDAFLLGRWTTPAHSDLPHISTLEFSQQGGNTLLGLFHSHHSLYRQAYPELNPKYEKMLFSPEKRRFLLDRFIGLAADFVHKKEDLVFLDSEFFEKYTEGVTILTAHQGSIVGIFSLGYPEVVIQHRCAQRGFWGDLKVNWVIQKVMKGYDLREMGDWYRLSLQQLSEIYGKQVSKENVFKLIKFFLPEEDWSYERFTEKTNKRARQRYVGIKLKQIFKNEVIFQDYVWKDGEMVVLFDFYIPERKLVIEYQGEQHYYSILSWNPIHTQNQRDLLKAKICFQNNLNILYIPFWWDNSLQSLQQFLNNSQPPYINP